MKGGGWNEIFHYIMWRFLPGAPRSTCSFVSPVFGVITFLIRRAVPQVLHGFVLNKAYQVEDKMYRYAGEGSA